MPYPSIEELFFVHQERYELKPYYHRFVRAWDLTLIPAEKERSLACILFPPNMNKLRQKLLRIADTPLKFALKLFGWFFQAGPDHFSLIFQHLHASLQFR